MDIPATRGIPTSVVEKTAIRKIAIRIVPFVALMFFINFLDRTAISFAAPNGMEADLGLTAAQFGFASGVFFIGYLVLEVPSNLALPKFGARVWLARIMITWGIVSLLFTWVQNYPQLVGLRFQLDVGGAKATDFAGKPLDVTVQLKDKAGRTATSTRHLNVATEIKVLNGRNCGPGPSN